MNPRPADTLTDLCPDGSEHEPVIETEQETSSFWGATEVTVTITVTCAKCGEQCRPRYKEEDEQACNN
jgi:hypothetical protein